MDLRSSAIVVAVWLIVCIGSGWLVGCIADWSTMP